MRIDAIVIPYLTVLSALLLLAADWGHESFFPDIAVWSFVGLGVGIVTLHLLRRLNDLSRR